VPSGVDTTKFRPAPAEKPDFIVAYVGRVSPARRPTRRILASLMNQGLLEEIGDTGSRRSRVRYGVTEKGMSVLTYFDGARDLIDIEDVLTKD